MKLELDENSHLFTTNFDLLAKVDIFSDGLPWVTISYFGGEGIDVSLGDWEAFYNMIQEINNHIKEKQNAIK